MYFIPSLFNLFFLINFIFSSNPTTEVYSFVHEKRWYSNSDRRSFRLDKYYRNYRKGGYVKISYINLQNGKYKEYYWFKFFFDFDAMKNKKEITYTFEDGMFGIRVLKKHEFTK